MVRPNVTELRRGSAHSGPFASGRRAPNHDAHVRWGKATTVTRRRPQKAF